MTKDYQEKLIKLAKNLTEYVNTSDCKDYMLLSKLDYLIGYILALEERKTRG